MITDGIVGKEGAIPEKMTEVEGNNERINEIKEKIRVMLNKAKSLDLLKCGVVTKIYWMLRKRN